MKKPSYPIVIMIPHFCTNCNGKEHYLHLFHIFSFRVRIVDRLRIGRNRFFVNNNICATAHSSCIISVVILFRRIPHAW